MKTNFSLKILSETILLSNKSLLWENSPDLNKEFFPVNRYNNVITFFMRNVMNYKRLSFFLILILFAFNSIYAVSRDFLSAYPSFEISEEINEDDLGLDFLSLFSYSQKKIVILCVNQNDPSDAQVLLESDYPLNWCSSTIGFSQKSQTFYFSLNGAEDENGFYKYQELYAVPAENKKFLSQNVQHLYVPEGWLFDRCVNFYLKGRISSFN